MGGEASPALEISVQRGPVWETGLGWEVQISDGNGATKRKRNGFRREDVSVVLMVPLSRMSSDYITRDTERAEEAGDEANRRNPRLSGEGAQSYCL